jgi:hypothetical protein
METETFSIRPPLHLLLDHLGAVRGYGWETKPSRIIARLGAPMSAPGQPRLGRASRRPGHVRNALKATDARLRTACRDGPTSDAAGRRYGPKRGTFAE